MVHCVNKNTEEFKALLIKTDMNPLVLAAKISIWQETNGLDNFPSSEEFLKNDRLQSLEYYQAYDIIKEFELNKISNIAQLIPVINSLQLPYKYKDILSKLSKTLNLEKVLFKIEDLEDYISAAWNESAYTITYNTKHLQRTPLSFTKTLIHELLHANFPVEYRHGVGKNDPTFSLLYSFLKNIKNNKENFKYKTVYNKYNELFKLLKLNTDKTSDDYYGLTNVDEFISEAYSNIQFQDFLKSVKFDKTQDFFDKIIDLLIALINLNFLSKKINKNSNIFESFKDIDLKSLDLLEDFEYDLSEKYIHRDKIYKYINSIDNSEEMYNPSKFTQDDYFDDEGLLDDPTLNTGIYDHISSEEFDSYLQSCGLI